MNKRVFAFDLDGTLTEHRTWISDENLSVLDFLVSRGIKLAVVGAGRARRIFTQLREYPNIDIIGNYGLQFAVYNDENADIEFKRDICLPCDTAGIEKRVAEARERFGFVDYIGDSIEFNPSGCVTIPLLGSKAGVREKIEFDPNGEKRRAIYPEMRELFPEYSVFLGGTTSLDLVPVPYNKLYALDLYAKDCGVTHDEIVYFGDDYKLAGNDEPVLLSDIDFVKVDKPSLLPALVNELVSK